MSDVWEEYKDSRDKFIYEKGHCYAKETCTKTSVTKSSRLVGSPLAVRLLGKNVYSPTAGEWSQILVIALISTRLRERRWLICRHSPFTLWTLNRDSHLHYWEQLLRALESSLWVFADKVLSSTQSTDNHRILVFGAPLETWDISNQCHSDCQQPNADKYRFFSWR